MPSKLLHKTKGLSREFVKYTTAGGCSFLVDFGLLILFIERGTHYLAAAALGFLGGLITNYLFCIFWVWKHSQATRMRDLLNFTLIGASGLGITELGMWLGVGKLGIHYQITKLFMVGVVLFWNFGMKRAFVFKPQVENT